MNLICLRGCYWGNMRNDQNSLTCPTRFAYLTLTKPMKIHWCAHFEYNRKDDVTIQRRPWYKLAELCQRKCWVPISYGSLVLLHFAYWGPRSRQNTCNLQHMIARYLLIPYRPCIDIIYVACNFHLGMDDDVGSHHEKATQESKGISTQSE